MTDKTNLFSASLYLISTIAENNAGVMGMHQIELLSGDLRQMLTDGEVEIVDVFPEPAELQMCACEAMSDGPTDTDLLNALQLALTGDKGGNFYLSGNAHGLVHAEEHKDRIHFNSPDVRVVLKALYFQQKGK